ncbi:putative cupin superfamily protein [Bradyrhizobium yuanmingense]|uniref:Cupin superfamily protein n=1 Tax=Bradyrhizobium yuanmingense TaxID=108015 RepID=A0ABV4GIL8_9BRAD
MAKNPRCLIVHYKDIQDPDCSAYPGSVELLSIGSTFSRHFRFRKLGIHHELLPPGRRTSFPHAESSEEEFVFVLEGRPHAWIDGHAFKLKPGDGVGFLPGTGISHCFINNTDAIVRLLVVGEANKKTNKIFYPLNPELKARKRRSWWHNPPSRSLGSADPRPKRKSPHRP